MAPIPSDVMLDLHRNSGYMSDKSVDVDDNGYARARMTMVICRTRVWMQMTMVTTVQALVPPTYQFDPVLL
jgi:hypothetical protein